MIQPRAYEGNEPYIFVSYAHKDSNHVLPIITSLQAQGFRVWYDAGIEAGTEWPEYIAGRLDGCAVFLAFISEAALASQNCRREINFAIELQKEHLIIYMEDVKLSLGMRMQLGTMQALFRNRHSTQESFLDELCRSHILKACRGANIVSASRPVSPAPVSVQSGPAAPKANANELFRKAESPFNCGQYKEAIPLLRQAAQLGHGDACFRLGYCYEHGYGFSRPDRVEAERWFVKAAEHGSQLYEERYLNVNADEAYEKGTWYESFKKDYTEGEIWLLAAAEKGHIFAQKKLADWYTRGMGEIKKNRSEAFRWYLEAAKQGDAQAQYMVAEHYRMGIVVKKDTDEAREWYRKSARQRYASAVVYLHDRGLSW